MSSAAVAALLAQLNNLPPGVNGYEYAADQVRTLVSSPGNWGVHYSQLAVGILNGAVCIAAAALVVIRVRRGGFWLVRRESTSAGTLIMRAELCRSSLTSQSQRAQRWSRQCARLLAGRRGTHLDHVRRGDNRQTARARVHGLCSGGDSAHSTPRILLCRCAVIVAARANDADLSALALPAVRAAIVRYPPRWHLATMFSAFVVGCPLVISAVIVACSLVTGLDYVHPAVSNVSAIRDALLQLAPTWTGRIDLTKLLPLVPLAQHAADMIPPAKTWLRVTYAIWAAIICLTFIVRTARLSVELTQQAWLPLSVRQILSLRRQTALLKPEPQIVEEKSDGSAALPSLGKDAPIAPPRLWARPSFHRSGSSWLTAKSSSARTNSDAEVAEARVLYLWRLCVFRQVILTCTLESSSAR